MNAPIALQLYSVREQLKQDFEGTLQQVKNMGYTAVETGEFAGDPRRQAKVFEDLDLQVVAAHVKPPVGNDEGPVLDFMSILGTDRVVVPWLDPETYFQSEDGILRAAELLNQAGSICSENNLHFHYHNHDFEFGRINGRLAFDLLLEYLDPSVLFEIDTYWVQTAGTDATSVVRELGDRAPLLHLKDGLLKRDLPMVAVGDGHMDFAPLVAAGAPHTKWLIVELDSCAGDMMHAVARSIFYLNNLEISQ